MKSRLLARVPKSVFEQSSVRSFSAGGGKFDLSPLFEVAPQTGAGIGAAALEPYLWLLAETEQHVDSENQWDMAHQSLSQTDGLSFATAGAPLVVEPDLLQSWAYPGSTGTPGQAMVAAAAAPCTFEDQRSDLPRGPGFAWHLGPEFSELAKARAGALPGSNITIAHFDTGYDPNHETRPENLDTGRQRNFVESDRPKDARDPQDVGMFRNPGHGTATLALLAGNKTSGSGDYLGGAPHARVVPVRVANSVVQFYTSAVAQAFDYARELNVDVVSMSMGGVASAAWTDAVNAAYEAGIVMVCAGGNNYGGFPTRFVVYPARFRRVIAACGAMANGQPYFNLPMSILQGNYGPPSKMRTAISAYTPNVPWARIGCGKLVDMDGAGTSAATPQVAAAAALWLAAYNPQYPEKWMRVEAARKSLFEAARTAANANAQDFYGNGLLRAAEALKSKFAPAPDKSLVKTPRDSAFLPFLRAVTGLGLAADARTSMFALEITQLSQTTKALEEAIEDPDVIPEQVSARERQRFLEAVIEGGKSSRALRAQLEQRITASGPARVTVPGPVSLPRSSIKPPRPANRRLRIFAVDPSLGCHLDTAFLNVTSVKVPWERNDSSDNLLQPGPVGEYVEVVDIDPSSGSCYAPVDLNEPFVLAQDGLEPSEGNPQFHQQMVYAVTMLTIRHFEQALGRAALWSSRLIPLPVPKAKGKKAQKPQYMVEYVPRLRIYPHALREANAYYSPDKKALLFGYFPADQPNATETGGLVFGCLSHDIVAHESTHALLDGLHRRYQEATNADVLAFHEAFADIVAIFQHFTFPEILRYEIQAKGGDLTKGDLLAGLAQQFGQALGRSRALRSAINVDPAKINYTSTMEPHARGSVLVAAVFDAFLAIYKRKIADLLRISTNGTGVLPAGALHPDLVNRLADEAAKTAGHILHICIRALDYCPPVDITFGSYLRALITADWDAVPDDETGYRVAFVEAFRAREIFPENVRTMSVESLRWQEPRQQPAGLADALGRLTLEWDLFTNRRLSWESARANAIELHSWLTVKGNISPGMADEMGISLEFGDDGKCISTIEVHSVRPARRTAPDGSFITDLVVVITQKRPEPVDPADKSAGTFNFRGGCTLLIDLRKKRIRYIVSRNINSSTSASAMKRLQHQREYEQQKNNSLQALYFNEARNGAEPFAMLHRGL
jgi:hypothetical protein